MYRCSLVDDLLVTDVSILDYAKESREQQAAREAAGGGPPQRGTRDTTVLSSNAGASTSRMVRQPGPSDARSMEHISSSPVLPTGPSPSTRLAQATSPVRLTYPGCVTLLFHKKTPRDFYSNTFPRTFDVTGILPHLANCGLLR